MITKWYYNWPTEEEAEHRLSTLSKFLRDQVPEEQLNMGSWVATGSCGFAGCAIGWATRIPEFQELGFSIDSGAPCYKFSCSWDAVKEFFGLEEEEAFELFSQVCYKYGVRITPVHVADRIDDLLRRKYGE